MQFFKNIDGKTITSAGGIVVSLVLAYFLYQLAGEKLTNVAKAVNSFETSDNELKKNLTDALLKNATAIEGNTRVMQQFIITNQTAVRR